MHSLYLSLAIFAILYSIRESIRTDNKENKVNNVLDSIKENVGIVTDKLSEVQKVSKDTYDVVLNRYVESIKENPKKIKNITKDPEGKTIEKGDIYYAKVREGLPGIRPVVILKTTNGSICLVAPTTTLLQKNILETHIQLGVDEVFSEPSIIICEKATLIFASDLLGRISKLNEHKMMELEKIMNDYLDV